MKHIRPCPFCGSEVERVKGRTNVTAKITFFVCEKCGALVSFNGAEDKELATIRWNRREELIDDKNALN